MGWGVSWGVGGRGGGKEYGRKLQADDGRWETRVKISEMRRCCTEVSWWGRALVFS